jgi:general transcription factor 3C polypeptide 4
MDTISDDLFLGMVVHILDVTTAGFYAPSLIDDGHTDQCTASGYAPIKILLPVFLHLRKADRLNRVLPQLLQILEPNILDDVTTSTVNPWTTMSSPEMNREFRRQLTTHLFGWDDLVTLRLRLAIADFCWVCVYCAIERFFSLNSMRKKHLKDPQLQENCGKVAQMLLNSISQKVLRIMLRFLVAVMLVLTGTFIIYI